MLLKRICLKIISAIHAIANRGTVGILAIATPREEGSGGVLVVGSIKNNLSHSRLTYAL